MTRVLSDPVPEARYSGGTVVADATAVADSSAMALTAVIWAGSLPLVRAEFEAVMASRLGEWAHVGDLWSGYFELTSSAVENLRVGLTAMPDLLHAGTLPVLLYLALCLAAAWMTLPWSGAMKALLGAATLVPLLASVVAMDHYRWVGMSANLALLSVLAFAAPNDTWPRLGALRPVVTALLLFALLAPLGVLPGHPFPMQQFLLERLGVLGGPAALDHGRESSE